MDVEEVLKSESNSLLHAKLDKFSFFLPWTVAFWVSTVFLLNIKNQFLLLVWDMIHFTLLMNVTVQYNNVYVE